MKNHANVAVFEKAYKAFTTGDMKELAEVFTEDVVWHTPGPSPIGGDFRGRNETLQSFAVLFERSGGTYRPEIHDLLANDQHTVALMRATAQCQEKTLDRTYALVFHIADGRIKEAWETDTDTAAWNDFWS